MKMRGWEPTSFQPSIPPSRGEGSLFSHRLQRKLMTTILNRNFGAQTHLFRVLNLIYQTSVASVPKVYQVEVNLLILTIDRELCQVKT